MLFDQLRFVVAELQLRFQFFQFKMFFTNEHTEGLNVINNCFIVIRNNCSNL